MGNSFSCLSKDLFVQFLCNDVDVCGNITRRISKVHLVYTTIKLDWLNSLSSSLAWSSSGNHDLWTWVALHWRSFRNDFLVLTKPICRVLIKFRTAFSVTDKVFGNLMSFAFSFNKSNVVFTWKMTDFPHMQLVGSFRTCNFQKFGNLKL